MNQLRGRKRNAFFSSSVSSLSKAMSEANFKQKFPYVTHTHRIQYIENVDYASLENWTKPNLMCISSVMLRGHNHRRTVKAAVKMEFEKMLTQFEWKRGKVDLLQTWLIIYRSRERFVDVIVKNFHLIQVCCPVKKGLPQKSRLDGNFRKLVNNEHLLSEIRFDLEFFLKWNSIESNGQELSPFWHRRREKHMFIYSAKPNMELGYTKKVSEKRQPSHLFFHVCSCSCNIQNWFIEFFEAQKFCSP